MSWPGWGRGPNPIHRAARTTAITARPALTDSVDRIIRTPLRLHSACRAAVALSRQGRRAVWPTVAECTLVLGQSATVSRQPLLAKPGTGSDIRDARIGRRRSVAIDLGRRGAGVPAARCPCGRPGRRAGTLPIPNSFPHEKADQKFNDTVVSTSADDSPRTVGRRDRPSTARAGSARSRSRRWAREAGARASGAEHRQAG